MASRGTAGGSDFASRERLKGNLDLLLLSVLQSGPAHGYEIITLLRQRSAGAFDLPEGTVYPALHRLEKVGRLASDWSAESGRRRRVYWLTDDGLKALRAERQAWLRFSSAVGTVMGATA